MSSGTAAGIAESPVSTPSSHSTPVWPSVLLLGALMLLRVLPLRVALPRRTRMFAMCATTGVLISFSAILICAGVSLTPPALASRGCPVALGSAQSARLLLCLPLWLTGKAKEEGRGKTGPRLRRRPACLLLGGEIGGYRWRRPASAGRRRDLPGPGRCEHGPGSGRCEHGPSGAFV